MSEMKMVLSDDEINELCWLTSDNTTLRAVNDRAMARNVEQAVLQRVAPAQPVAEAVPAAILSDDFSPIDETLVERLRIPVTTQSVLDMPGHMADACTTIQAEAADAIDSLMGQLAEEQYSVECARGALKGTPAAAVPCEHSDHVRPADGVCIECGETVQAPAAPVPPEITMPQYWCVEVRSDGETLVSIGNDWLSGSRTLEEGDEQTIIGAAKHLLSFVGYGLPQSAFDPDEPSSAPVVNQQVTTERVRPVAYLDLGAGGYMELGTELSQEQLSALPKGRHMLGVIGTHGVDGYVAAQLSGNSGEVDAYLCKAWGETDLPAAAIVNGLNGVRAFLIAEWLGEANHQHDDGTNSLDAAMQEMREGWDLEGTDWEWSAEFEIGGISVQRVGHAAIAATNPAQPLSDPEELDAAARDVLAERRRQIEAEDWSPEHDDEHVNDELAALAAFYAMPPGVRDWPATETGYGDTLGLAILPEGWAATVNDDRRRDLVKASALCIAEIERLDRAAIAAMGGEN